VGTMVVVMGAAVVVGGAVVVMLVHVGGPPEQLSESCRARAKAGAGQDERNRQHTRAISRRLGAAAWAPLPRRLPLTSGSGHANWLLGRSPDWRWQ
jgi:hypothetical protein